MVEVMSMSMSKADHKGGSRCQFQGIVTHDPGEVHVHQEVEPKAEQVRQPGNWAKPLLGNGIQCWVVVCQAGDCSGPLIAVHGERVHVSNEDTKHEQKLYDLIVIEKVELLQPPLDNA